MKKQLTTYQAFTKLINLRAIHNELEMKSTVIRGWRKKVNDNPDDPTKWGITINKIEELLTKSGHTVIQEKLWKSN